MLPRAILYNPCVVSYVGDDDATPLPVVPNPIKMPSLSRNPDVRRLCDVNRFGSKVRAERSYVQTERVTGDRRPNCPSDKNGILGAGKEGTVGNATADGPSNHRSVSISIVLYETAFCETTFCAFCVTSA